MTRYEFEQIGTVITDRGDGQVTLVFGRPGENLEEIIEQAQWVRKTFDAIHTKYSDRGLQILADLEKLDRVTLDDRVRAIYREIIEQPYIEKIAIAGDAFSFTKVLTILIKLTKHRKRVKFFFNPKEARDWLGW